MDNLNDISSGSCSFNKDGTPSGLEKERSHEASITSHPVTGSTGASIKSDIRTSGSPKVSSSGLVTGTSKVGLTDSHGDNGLKNKAADIAHNLTDKASGLVETLTERASTTGTMLKEKTAHMMDTMRHADYRGMSDTALRPVRAFPERSILIALGVGFVLGMLSARMSAEDDY